MERAWRGPSLLSIAFRAKNRAMILAVSEKMRKTASGLGS
jgi:hypothetical protein